MIPVAANDVCFSMHAVILTAFTLFQIFIYEVTWKSKDLEDLPSQSLLLHGVLLHFLCFIALANSVLALVDLCLQHYSSYHDSH
ncbi:Cystinosin-like protein [Bienertia sinuspersici]